MDELLIQQMDKQIKHLEETVQTLLRMIEGLTQQPVAIIAALNPVMTPAAQAAQNPYGADAAPQLPDDPWSDPRVPTAALLGSGWGNPPELPDTGLEMKNELPDG